MSFSILTPDEAILTRLMPLVALVALTILEEAPLRLQPAQREAEFIVVGGKSTSRDQIRTDQLRSPMNNDEIVENAPLAHGAYLAGSAEGQAAQAAGEKEAQLSHKKSSAFT